MSIVQRWGQEDPRDLLEETKIDKLYSMPDSQISELFFACLRNGCTEGVRSLLTVKPDLIDAPLFGFEGADSKGIINAPSQRCYTYTGIKRDGFFSPLHVAAEGGHKLLTMLLLQAGVDKDARDYREHSAMEVATGDAVHAFYEMQGLFYDEKERYEGNVDRFKKRTRQGTLFFKCKGYHEKEYILYTGSWKDNLYDGNGILYYPGTDVVRYVGRFKSGKMHGRGVEMDRQGRKVYAGGFREDLRDGRGELFDPTAGSEDSAVSETTTDAVTLARLNSIVREPELIYKGELHKGEMHGFGVRYFPGGHRYIGRFDRGEMSGIGIYVYGNGDRYEGMFVANRRDGPGSMYSYDAATGKEIGKHAMFTSGLKGKELTSPFVPKVIDLPEDHIGDKLAALGLTADEEGKKSDRRTKIDEMLHSNSDAPDWKKKLGKYLRLSAHEARELKLIGKGDKQAVEDAFDERQSIDSLEEESHEEGDDEWGDTGGDDFDDVTGYHFVDIPGLFVAYAYVCAAAKVFESREATREFHKMPDFEEVYHLIIDAVDSYNDSWENEHRKTTSGLGTSISTASVHKVSQGVESSEASDPATAEGDGGVKNKKQLFMSAAAIKEETLEKQRQELALKQGNLHLDPAVEKRLGLQIVENLKSELNWLLEEDSTEVKRAEALETLASGGEGIGANSGVAEEEKKNKQEQVIPSGSEPESARNGAGGSFSWSFSGKIDESGFHCKNAFAAEVLEIMNMATSFFT